MKNAVGAHWQRILPERKINTCEQQCPIAICIISRLLAEVATRTAPRGSVIRVTLTLAASKMGDLSPPPRPLEIPIHPLHHGPPRPATRARRTYLERIWTSLTRQSCATGNHTFRFVILILKKTEHVQ